MLTLVPLCLLLGWMLPVDSMAVPFRVPPPASNQDIPLSMVESSVDDMYRGCDLKMKDSVRTHYLEKELHDKDFKKAWYDCVVKEPKENTLTENQIRAICVYTGDLLYREFNEAVRTQGPDYSKLFKFHSLHFLLTSAIQILNSNYLCYTTYRRSDLKFIGHVNQIVRFGFFASSSFKADLHQFGNKTCFKIKTCFGAFLGDYSVYPHEEEVLIPPYETFRVSEIHTGASAPRELEDCEVVYELESEAAVSNLNCRALIS